MAIKHVGVTEDSTCPFCGTLVKRGYSVCPSCGAEHGYEDKTVNLGCLFMFIIVFGGWTLNEYLDKHYDINPLFAWIVESVLLLWLWMKIQNNAKKNSSWWK